MTSSRYLTLTRYLTLSSALGRNRVTEVGSLSANANLATKFLSGVYLLFLGYICRFSRNCKFAKFIQYDMQYIKCNSELLAGETLFLYPKKNTILPKDFQKVLKSLQIFILRQNCRR